MYFCEQSFITHHSTGHTCESVIFYNLEIAIIKTLCTFTYYATLNPDPVVLDSGSQLLNQAAYLYFPELLPDLNLKLDVILEKPRKNNLAKVQLITDEDKNVVQHKPRPMMLPSAMKNIRQNQTMFNSKGDKALAIDDVLECITWQNKPVGFVFFGSILAIISLLTIFLLWIFYKLKMKFFRTFKDKITTKASIFPKFLTNTFGRFRNSRKGIKPLNRPVRYKARSQTVTMRPPISTCQRIENP